MACASRRLFPPSRRNPASAARARASRRHNPAMSVAKRNSPPGRKHAGNLLRGWHPGRSAASSAAVSARDRDRADPRRASAAAGSQSIRCDRVTEMQADIGKLALLDAGQRLGDGIDESVAADEADARDVCAPAQGDARRRRSRFPGGSSRPRPETGSRRSAGARHPVDRQLRQQRFEQRRLARPQGMAFAPAEEGALGIAALQSDIRDTPS